MRSWIARHLLQLAYRLDREVAEDHAARWLEAREFRLAYEQLMRKIAAVPMNIARIFLGLEPLK